MDMTINTANASATGVAARTAASAPELEEPVARAAEKQKAEGPVLAGPGLTVTDGTRLSLAEQLAQIRGNGSPDQAKALSNMMNSYFETLQNTAKNMGPSEKDYEIKERRKEELEKQIKDLEAKKVTLEEAMIRFENTFLAATDKDLLETNMAKQRPVMV